MRASGWDDGFDDSTPVVRELLYDGVHQAQIRDAKDDGERTTIVIAPHGQFKLLYVDLRDDEKSKKKAAGIASALGISAADWAATEPAELVGKRLRVETRQWVSPQDGKTRVAIDKFLPFLDEPPAAKPARTQAAKVAAARGEEAGGADEIPFMWLVPFLLSAFLNGGFV